jgi:PASTA domain
MPDRWINPEGWGSPPRRGPTKGWPGRRWVVGLAAASVVLGVVALGSGNDGTNPAVASTTPPATSDLPSVTTTTTPPTTTTAPPTTLATVEVPKLVGMRLTSAKAALADLGLRARVTYRPTARYQAGTVISQSRRTGAGVLPDSRITVVVAKAPPPPPTTAPPPPTTTPARNCDPSYPDVCLDPNALDYDCAGGSGDGPSYVNGPIRVRPPDPFDLDREGDGWGCERG